MVTLLDRKRNARPTAWLVAASMVLPMCLVGCGGKGADTANVPPPVDDTRSSGRTASAPMQSAPMQSAQPPKTGMSTGKKVVIVLAGAALLYYLYKHHEKAKEMAGGKEVQYYKSEKTGRIYYRDPQTHQAHWVTPPSVELSDTDAQELSRYQGYNQSTGGEDYTPAGHDSGPAPQ